MKMFPNCLICSLGQHFTDIKILIKVFCLICSLGQHFTDIKILISVKCCPKLHIKQLGNILI